VGFLAVCDGAGALQWLLHCETSEPFRAARIVDDDVFAVSEEYPRRFEWRIPFRSPWMFRVSASR